MFKFIFFSFFSLASFSLQMHGENSFFHQPPKGWECIQDSSQLPLKIKVIYIGKGTAGKSFTPSINVANEITSLPIGEYVNMAKTYHEKEGGSRCLHLGKVKTLAGEAEMFQIDRPSQWGAIRFLQAILIVHEQAYVVTATCLKEDFSSLSAIFFKAIQSFQLPR
jgi:hypothetical protein